MPDCRTCKHNTYRDIPATDWVSCCHPITIKKAVAWANGDPAWVNMLTGDLHISRIDEIGDCPTHETAEKYLNAN